MNNKLIFVAGHPSGGTSCVAGILHHLGVNMGEIRLAPGTRGYVTFEDSRMTKCGAEGFRDFITARIAEGPGRAGLKGSATYWMADEEPSTLPIELLVVHRPLDDSIDSMLRLWTTNETRKARLAQEVNPMQFLRHRAEGIAGSRFGVKMLSSIIEPTLEVDYQTVVESPQMSVIQIQHAFDLGCPTESFQAAVRSVDPEMKHI